MTDERFTDRPPQRPPADPWRAAPVFLGLSQRLKILGGAFLGLLGGVLLGVLLFHDPHLYLERNRERFALGVAGLILGAYATWLNVRDRPGRGVRVREERLPAGGPPAPATPQNEAIVTAPRPAPSVAKLGGHRRAISGLALSPDGALASGCDEGAVIVHDLRSGFPRWAARDCVRVVDLAFSPDGRLLAVAGTDGREGVLNGLQTSVRVYDALDGRELRRLESHESLISVTFLSDRHLIVGAWCELRLWELETPWLQRVIPVARWLGYGTDQPVALAACPEAVVVGCFEGQEARVYTLDGRRAVTFRRHRQWLPLVRPGAVTSVAVSPSGHHVLSGGLDGCARVWTFREGRQTACFRGHRGWWGWHGVTAVAWLSDGEALSASEEGTLRRWDARTGEELARHSHGRAIVRLAARGRTAVTGAGDGTIRVWAV